MHGKVDDNMSNSFKDHAMEATLWHQAALFLKETQGAAGVPWLVSIWVKFNEAKVKKCIFSSIRIHNLPSKPGFKNEIITVYKFSVAFQIQ
jgi:hypothetical protein